MCAPAKGAEIAVDYPIRKEIRLKNFDYAASNAYFVTICCYHRAHLFGKLIYNKEKDTVVMQLNKAGKLIEYWLREIHEKYPDTELDQYIIMPDHVHFILLCTPLAGAHVGAHLPEIIKWFKSQTTNAYIRWVKEGLLLPFDKHIWQRNYYEHVIRNDQDLDETRAYIQYNPLKVWLLETKE